MQIHPKKARIMQDTKDLKDQHPGAGPGLEGALSPLRNGEKGTGVGKGLLEAMHNFRGKMKGKRKYAVKLR